MEASAPPNALTPAQLTQHILQHPGEECFRHVLAHTGDYEFDADGEVRVRNSVAAPDPTNWGCFQSNVALDIGVLKLDLSTVRSFPVWTAVQQTAPATFSLPQLHTLHISMDQVNEQIHFATRFLTPTLRDLSLLVFPLQRRMCYRSDTPRYSNKPATQLENFLDAVAETWYPSEAARDGLLSIPQLYAAVEPCKELQRLRFVVADVHTAYATYKLLVDMVRSLNQLRALVVARHTAVAPILCLLSDHPALQSFGAFQADFHPGAVTHREDRAAEQVYGEFWIIWDQAADDPATQEPHIALRAPVQTALTALTLEIDPPQFLDVAREWAADGVCCARVESLHLHCTTRESGLEASAAEAHELLALLPSLFPALRTLRAGPLCWSGHKADGAAVRGTRRFCVTAPALRALAPLHALEDLMLEAAYAPCVSAAEWAAVLPSWPRLRVLYLTISQPLFTDAPDAPLDDVLRVFAECAPQIARLLLSAAPVAGAAEGCALPSALRELCVVHDDRVPDCEGFEAFVAELGRRGVDVMCVPVFHVDERPELDEEAAHFDRAFSRRELWTASITGKGYEDALAYFRSTL
ncbi:hypothetical protein PsYK624_042990 [Phanerochaete sordida]|uniref:Uncharacterized protein n=1 Tax=Phanerochaete sordida TaxID=48140 RepID=A0A9P3G4Q0_9APHY|nr:hypothetical protein PsYK624_042990 [Phanerochaete sordida]